MNNFTKIGIFFLSFFLIGFAHPKPIESILESTQIVPFKVLVLGDSQSFGIANYLSANLPGPVYFDGKIGRSTKAMLKKLRTDRILIQAIKNSNFVLIFVGGNDPEPAISGNLEKIYRQIKQINSDILIAAIDIPISERLKLIPNRFKVNETISNLEHLIDFHIKTNEKIELEYQPDNLHLNPRSKRKLSCLILNEIFGIEKKPEEITQLNCYTKKKLVDYMNIQSDKTIRAFTAENWAINAIENSKSINQNPEPNQEFLHSQLNYNELVPYFQKDLDTLFLRIFENPTTDSTQKQLPLGDDFNEAEFMELMATTNLFNIYSDNYKFIDSLRESIVNPWEKYIAELPLNERLTWIFLKKMLIKAVYYAGNNSEISPEMLGFEKVYSYLESIKNEDGKTEYFQKNGTVLLTPLPNIELMYFMIYNAILAEKLFPKQTNAYSMLLTLLSIGNIETGNNYNCMMANFENQKTIKYRGALKLNYKTANELFVKNSEFWGSFYTLEKSPKKINFTSLFNEIQCYNYLLNLIKPVNKRNDEFEAESNEGNDLQLPTKQLENWIQLNYKFTDQYRQKLMASLALYHHFFAQNTRKENQSDELINEVIRKEYQKKYGGKQLPKSEFLPIGKVVKDGREILSEDYAKNLDYKLYTEKKYSVEDGEVKIMNKFMEAKNLNDGEFNRLQINSFGDLTYTFAPGETGYQLAQNRVGFWINYHNQTIDNRYPEGKKFIFCAETDSVLIVIEPFENYESLTNEIKHLVTKPEFDSLTNLDRTYLLLNKLTIEGYTMLIRTGNPEKLKTEIKNLKNQLKEQLISKKNYRRKINQLKNKYHTVSSGDVFYLPYNDFIFMKSTGNYFVLKPFVELINTSTELQQKQKYIDAFIRELEESNKQH